MGDSHFLEEPSIGLSNGNLVGMLTFIDANQKVFVHGWGFQV